MGKDDPMIVLLTALLFFIFTVLFILKKKNMLGWLPQYIKQRTTNALQLMAPRILFFRLLTIMNLNGVCLMTLILSAHGSTAG